MVFLITVALVFGLQLVTRSSAKGGMRDEESPAREARDLRQHRANARCESPARERATCGSIGRMPD